MNTFLLFLLVIAAYLNLFLVFKRSKKGSRKTKLPISSKQYSQSQKEVDMYKSIDEKFKVWLRNKEMLDK